MRNYHAPFFCDNATHKRCAFHCFTIEHKNLRIMDSDHEEDRNIMVTELEVPEENEEEEPVKIEAISIDEFSMETLRKLP